MTILASVNAERVKVLHITDGDTVVVSVSHHLVLISFQPRKLFSISSCGEKAKARKGLGAPHHCHRNHYPSHPAHRQLVR